jgi:hypothetical protein
MFQETHFTYKDDIFFNFYLPVGGESTTLDFMHHKKQKNFETNVFELNIYLFSYTAEEKNKGTS